MSKQTTQQIHQLEREELSRLVEEMLMPLIDRDMSISKPVCSLCDLSGSTWIEGGVRVCNHCEIPPIWPEAMKRRNWAVEKFGYAVWRKSLTDVYFAVVKDIKISFDMWLCCYIQSHHITRAALLCVLEDGSD